MVSSKQLVSIYSLFIGLFMIGFWCMLLLTDQVPAGQRLFAISFHLAGEFLTAALLVVSGVGIWLKKSWSNFLSPLALGLLLYTIIVSPGYYAQLGDLAMVSMFMVLTILTLLATYVMFRNRHAFVKNNL